MLKNIIDPVKSAESAHEKALSRLEEFKAQLLAATTDLAACNDDFDRNLTLREKQAGLDRMVAAAKDALLFAENNLSEARQAREKSEADRAHTAATKTAVEAGKLTVEILAASGKLAADLARLADLHAQVNEANKVRGDRPFIVDGERRLREIPARDVPASTRREKVWVNAAGERPSQLRAGADGRNVPADHNGPYEFREVEVVQSAARTEPARMPERLADAVRLVDRHGGQIWPPR